MAVSEANSMGAPEAATPATDAAGLVDNADILTLLTNDFKRIKVQKARPTGGIEARTLINLAFVLGEHYVNYQQKGLYSEQQDPNKLYLVFNLINPRLSKLIGRLTSHTPVFKASPNKKDAEAIEQAEVVDRLIKALDQKLIQDSRTWELLWWMAIGGVAFEYCPWIPNASIEPTPQYSDSNELLFKTTMDGSIVPQSQMQAAIEAGAAPETFEIYEEAEPIGEVGSEILGPLNVFIDQSVKSIADLSSDQRVYIAKIRTLGWIEDTFGVKVDPDKNFTIVSTQFHHIGSSTGGIFLKDLIPLVQGSADDSDPAMAVVVEGYAPASKKNPNGRYTCFIPGKQILHDGENPYGDIPLVDFHWKPVTTTFWNADYITDLIAPQRFINKRLSQLGEQSNATIYSQLLLGGALKASDIPADFPGCVANAIGENGQPLVQRLGPPQLPAWFMESINLTMQMFNDVAGGADLFNSGKFPGQMRGPMAVPMMQELLDTEWGPLFSHLGERLARVKQMRLDRVKQFYPPSRTMHYTDRDQKDEVMTFHTDKVLKGGLNFNVTVERGSMLPELRALREARISERLSGPLSVLYVDERTGRLDKSKIAADLQFGDAGRESREAQYRKLGKEIVDMLWLGKPCPQVLPFYDHAVMADELEAAMATTEFLKASPQIQQLFNARWEMHRQFMSQEAQAQQMGMQSTMVHGAVAQATQQAAAQAAAEAVHMAMTEVTAAKSVPTEQIVQSAAQGVNLGGNPQQAAPKRPLPA